MIKRIISRIDIKNSYLVKGIQLEGLRVLGYPEEFAKALSLSMEAVKRSIKSGLIPRRNFATPSTTTIGIPFKK